MPAARGLLRCHRQEQPRPRRQDDQDAGRRVRRGGELARADRGNRMTIEITKEISHSPPPAVPERALGVEVVSMTKRFGEFTALEAVSLKVPAGTFHALLGENGAGKSTLVKCLVGYHRPDAGEIVVGQRERDIRSPHDAHTLGIGMVYQHFTLVPSMTVAENLVMARDDVPARIRWRRERERLPPVMTPRPLRLPTREPADPPR